MKWGFGLARNYGWVYGHAHDFMPHPRGFSYCFYEYKDPSGAYAWTCNKPRSEHTS